MRKRVMSLALAAAMVMSMGACGKNDNAGEAGKASVSDAAGNTLNESMEVPSESTVEMTDPEGCVFKLSDEKVEFEGVEDSMSQSDTWEIRWFWIPMSGMRNHPQKRKDYIWYLQPEALHSVSMNRVIRTLLYKI